jgi:2,3-bisphosphoglycerate-dependent phosphoglycerate mutase
MGDGERPRAFLIRHCESTGQEPDAPLTARGYAQARALAVQLAPPAHGPVITSPWRRARETAAPLAGDVAPVVDPRLREWQLPFIPVEEWPRALQPIFAGTVALPSEVESLADARARGLAAVREAPPAAAIVTHGKLLALVVSALGGLDPYAVFVGLQNPHVFELSASGAVRALRLAAGRRGG